MNIEEHLEVAAAAREKLEALHGEFMAAIRALKESKVNGAEFRCVDGELEATCLGVQLPAKHRLVARAGELALIEYTFIANHAGEAIPIWSIYLAPSRRVYADAAIGNVLCDMTNEYLPSRTAAHLASKLLASKVFAPRHGG